MNRRSALTVIAGSAIAGVLAAVAITTAVADSRDGSDTAKTPDKKTEASAPSDSAPPRSGPLSKDDLLTADELRSIGYPIDDATSLTGEGDLQYEATPCLQESVKLLGDGATYSGDWSGSGYVMEVVTESTDAEKAVEVGDHLVGLHFTGCNGNDSVTVGDVADIEDPRGTIRWFKLEQALPAGGTKTIRVGVIMSGPRVAFIAVSNEKDSPEAFKKVLMSALDRMA
jgi:hypothetical protein